MKKEELELEKRCRDEARRQGWVACKLEKNGHKGIPDDIFMKDFFYFLVEFKKNPSQKPRKEQKTWLERFPNSAFLVGSYDQFLEILSQKK